jgi:hypothetical protein
VSHLAFAWQWIISISALVLLAFVQGICKASGVISERTDKRIDISVLIMWGYTARVLYHERSSASAWQDVYELLAICLALDIAGELWQRWRARRRRRRVTIVSHW